MLIPHHTQSITYTSEQHTWYHVHTTTTHITYTPQPHTRHHIHTKATSKASCTYHNYTHNITYTPQTHTHKASRTTTSTPMILRTQQSHTENHIHTTATQSAPRALHILTHAKERNTTTHTSHDEHKQLHTGYHVHTTTVEMPAPAHQNHTYDNVSTTVTQDIT